jgi:hypothetical protein
MRKRIRGRWPSHGTVVAYVALFAALATGGAYAADKIGSRDIAKKAVKSKHIAKNAVKSKHVKDGQLKVADLAEEAKGARAFALAGRSDGLNTDFPHRGFVSATREGEGSYCLTPEAGGVDPTEDPPAVTVEYSASNDADLLAFWNKGATDCDEGEYQVLTFDFAAGGQPVLTDDVEFMIVVP